MTRRLVAGLVVLGLAIGVWALWPRGEPDSSPNTAVNAVASTSPTVAARTTSSAPIETHVVTTVEEAEEILRQLWFGWFEGIYNQDEERIKEVVGSQTLLDSARAAFGALALVKEPEPKDIAFGSIEVLLSNDNCLVIWATLDVTAFSGEGAVESSVHVLRRVDEAWRLTTLWINRNDLWESDCESSLEPLL